MKTGGSFTFWNLFKSSTWQEVLRFLLILALLITSVIGICCYPLYQDELPNIEYLNLLAQGKKCHSEFWCCYPISGLKIISFFFGGSVKSIYTLIFLRLFCFLIMAVLFLVVARFYDRFSGSVALGWLICMLYLADPTILYNNLLLKNDPFSNASMIFGMLIFLVCGDALGGLFVYGILATFSLFVMPKGIYYLVPFSGAVLVYEWTKHRLRGVLLLTAGFLVGLLLIQSLCAASGTSIIEDVRSILMMGSSRAILQGHPEYVDWWSGFLVPYFFRNTLLSLILMMGTVGVLLQIRTIERKQRFAVAAIITGAVLYVIMVPAPPAPYSNSLWYRNGAQYINPFMLPLLLLPAMALRNLPNTGIKNGLGLAVAITTVSVLAYRIPKMLDGQKPTQFMLELHQIDLVQGLLRESDTVLSAPNFPPAQKSTAFITFDELILKPDSAIDVFKEIVTDPKLKWHFSGEALAAALEKNRPALIRWEKGNFPLDWWPVLDNYLKIHQNEYALIQATGWRPVLILKERLPKQ